MAYKFRIKKYMEDDPSLYAIFLKEDVDGLPSPIHPRDADPIAYGLTRSEAYLKHQQIERQTFSLK